MIFSRGVRLLANEVRWNKYIYDRFCELAMLSDFEKKVLETRIKKHSITQQALELNCSASTINNVIRALKDKYDAVQKYPDSNLPKRRVSSEEEWMDSH